MSHDMKLRRNSVKFKSWQYFPPSYRTNSWNVSGISKCWSDSSWIDSLCIFFPKRCDVCIKFGFDGKAYWVERTSVTGKIAEAAVVKFSLSALIFYIFSFGRLCNRSISVVLTVYANKLTILCKYGNAALVAVIFWAIPGSGKLFCSFNIELMASYNQ